MNNHPNNRKIMSDMVVVHKPSEKKQTLPQKKEIVFDLPEKETVHHEESHVKKSTPISKKQRRGYSFWIIALICIIAISISVGGLISHATITIIPKKISGAIDTTFTLSQNNTKNTVFFATITKNFSESEVIPVEGYTDTESKSSGTVRFYNKSSLPQTIPVNTIIISSKNKQYVIKKTITIPPAKDTVLGSMDVSVEAKEIGADYNSDLDDFSLLKKTLSSDDLVIRSVTPLIGGGKKQEPFANEELLNQTKNNLKEVLRDNNKFATLLAQEIPKNMIVLPITIPTKTSTLTTESTDDGIIVTIMQPITLLLVNRSEIAQVLYKSLIKDGTLEQLTLESFSGLTIVSNDITNTQSVPEKIQVRITGMMQLYGLINKEEVQEKIVGNSRSQVKEYLESKEEIESFTLRMRPFWRRVLPAQKQDISVNYPLDSKKIRTPF